jgi:hypothetical protein
MECIDRIRRIIRQNWDEIGIAAALGHLVTHDASHIGPEYEYILEALRRSNADLKGAGVDTLREYVQSFNDDQVPGLVSNIKGIAHEVYFVEGANHDGDSVHAYLFNDTNHPDYDVTLYDDRTGESFHVQLKATESEAYAQSAIREVGPDRVVLTEELADKLGVHGSGITNEQLEADVDSVVDHLDDDESLWNYVPALSVWSIALIVATLATRYAKRQISRDQFVRMVTVFAGAKAVKIALIVALLSIPGIDVVTAALLFVKMAYSVKNSYTI